jgi:hypothetical protein
MTDLPRTPQEAAEHEARILRDLGIHYGHEVESFAALVEARRTVAIDQRAYAQRMLKSWQVSIDRLDAIIAEDERVLAEAKVSLETQNR